MQLSMYVIWQSSTDEPRARAVEIEKPVVCFLQNTVNINVMLKLVQYPSYEHSFCLTIWWYEETDTGVCVRYIHKWQSLPTTKGDSMKASTQQLRDRFNYHASKSKVSWITLLLNP